MGDWAIEANDTLGSPFYFRPVASEKDVPALVAELLTLERTGGIVVYRSVATGNYQEGGDSDDRQGLGLVSSEPVNEPACRYCYTQGGHNGDCVLNS